METRTFILTIALGNDAFAEYPGTEIARILRDAAETVDGYGSCDFPPPSVRNLRHQRKLGRRISRGGAVRVNCDSFTHAAAAVTPPLKLHP